LSDAPKKEIAELAKLVNERFGKLETRVENVEKASPIGDRNGGQEGGSETPIYKCKGANCGFATDDLSDFVTHVVRENLPKPAAEERHEDDTPPPKKHETVDDYLNCPECFPKFEAAFVKRGYKKPETEKKAEGGLPI